MEIPQVEAFLAVGTFGGFRRAADALRVTQPAISARIKALEDSLGVSLFDRGKTGMALSAAGRALRPHAEQLLRAVALARQAVHDLRPSSGGAITIAAALSICTYLLPDVLKRFQTAHPKTLITVRSGHSKEVLEMVLTGEAELGLARSLHHPEVETVSLRDDPLVLVGAPASVMARVGKARLEEVAAQPLILFDGLHGRHDMPATAARATSRLGLEVRLGEPFGRDPRVVELMTDRLLDFKPQAGDVLLFVGRGSSEAVALGQTEEVADAVSRRRGGHRPPQRRHPGHDRRDPRPQQQPVQPPLARHPAHEFCRRPFFKRSRSISRRLFSARS